MNRTSLDTFESSVSSQSFQPICKNFKILPQPRFLKARQGSIRWFFAYKTELRDKIGDSHHFLVAFTPLADELITASKRERGVLGRLAHASG